MLIVRRHKPGYPEAVAALVRHVHTVTIERHSCVQALRVDEVMLKKTVA